MTETQTDPLWQFVDPAGDSAWLWETRMRRDIVRPRDVLAVLEVENRDGSWLTAEGARGLRDALNRVLGDQGPDTNGYGFPSAAYEAGQALHAAQHRRLEAACRRIAGNVDEQAAILARLADEPHLDAGKVAGTMLGVQRRTVAALGDLLAALGGQP